MPTLQTIRQTPRSFDEYHASMALAHIIADRNFAFAVEVWWLSIESTYIQNKPIRQIHAPTYQRFLRAAMSDLGLLYQN